MSNFELNSFRNEVLELYKKAERSGGSGSWVGDGEARVRILELNGVDQAAFFPSVVKPGPCGDVLQSVLKYAWNGHLCSEKDHTKGEYIEVVTPDYWKGTKVPLRGCAYLSHSNHQMGHPNKPSLPSASLTGGSKKFADGMELLDNLSLLSEFANYLIKTVDPAVHAKMVNLRHKMMLTAPHVKAICSVSPSLHNTVGIILNRRSGFHKDSRDAKDSWAVMFVLGDFDGGEVVMKISGVTVTSRFQRGDAIVLRARDVAHGISEWKGSLRVTVVYYSKESVWAEYGAGS